MADINVSVTVPAVITATATDPNNVTVAVTTPAPITVSASVGNSGDMMKSVYDTDNDGVVDNAEALGGVAASSYIQTGNASWIDLTDGGQTALHSHAAVTVADTASIDMSLTGQQISAVAIFGTSAGVVAEGNHTHSYQPLDTELTAIAGLTSAADKGIQFTGAGTAGTFDLTTAGKALLDDADAAAQRTTLSVPANVGTSVADNFVSFSNTTGAQKDSGKGLTHLVYTLQWGLLANLNPADSTTYYIGGSGSQGTTVNRQLIYFPMGGTVISVDFVSLAATVLGSAETSSAWIRTNNTTDTLISNAIKQDVVLERFANSSLSISVNAGDTFEIKWTTPAWATNPTGCRFWGVVMVRV